MLGYQASDIKPDEFSVAISEQVRGVVVQCVAAEEAKALIFSSPSSSIASASPVLLSVFNSQQLCPSPALSLREMADKISKDLGLSASLSISAVIDQAVDSLGIGDRAVFRVDSGATARAKLEALLQEL